ARIIRADLAYFNAQPSGILLSRFVNDVWALRSAAANVLVAIGKDALTVVFLVGVMFYQDWALALIAFVAFPLAIRPSVGIGRRTGAFFSFITALLMAYQPVKALAVLNATLQEGLAAAQRVFEVLDIEPAIRDRPGARPLRVTGGEVRFTDVRFGYQPGTVALDGISFTVPAGSTVALVGPSGAGKSTVLNLIPRFYDAEAGSVAIDGQGVGAVTLASL